MRNDLFLRTDTLPEELPILFSNRSLYLNFSKQNINDPQMTDLISNYHTVPFFFSIPKSNDEKRKIALLHPLAQLQAFSYILRYEQLIISFCKNSFFSVRSPIKRNIPKTKLSELKSKEIKKIEEEFEFTNSLSVSSDEDQILFYNYFSYNKHKQIRELYNSVKFNRDKYRYKYFLKLDIQRCFPSIYTHSLAWAIFGDKSLAKKHKAQSYNELFPNATDSIMQKMNFNETHGIIVGPEFSRVISELLLTRVDINLHNHLQTNNLKNNKNYSIYRFIDDYFIFTQNEKDIDLIMKFLKSELDNYNLVLNTSKTHLQKKPFEISDSSIIAVKKIIKEFEYDKLLSSTKENIEYKSYNGKRNQWNDLFYKMENLIANSPDSKSRIINYFLKTIRSSIFFNEKYNHKIVLVNQLEIISNLYTLSISSKSTNYLIAIYIKIYLKIEAERKKQKELKNNNDDTAAESKNIIASCDFIEEKMFQYLFMVLKNNINNLDNMYDILVFMKLFRKKLSAIFLCELIHYYKNSYFICCSIAYYILNDRLDGIDSKYITVIKKLTSAINENINNYNEKGANFSILEADFFYFLNDFSKYPGFFPSFRDKLEKKLEKAYSLTNNGNPTRDPLNKDTWNKITKYSYYNWKEKPITFMRKVIKKSSNMSKINNY